ncbi:MAG TPA: deoxyribodipyrimidine photo-lyase [Anaerolineales bacterium]|nr:deoxyribodipyrimidine photo-lyase [Anaerolineales bacterium]
MTVIWWIRRDLRLTDNAVLQAALTAGPVVPVFILDPAFSGSSPRRKDFLYEGLHALDRDLRARGSYLVLHTGRPLDVLQKVRRETTSEFIFAEEDFTPYALKRDDEVARQLPLHLIHGQTVFHPREVLKADRAPYTVFTPYSKIWKARLARTLQIQTAPGRINTPTGIKTEPLPSFKVSPLFPAGEEEAQVRLEEFLHSRIFEYGENRNHMDLDGTSSLSPYLHFGMLGMRQAVHAAQQAIGQKKSAGAEVWLNELAWREFYIQILYHFPRVRKTAFNPRLANIAWQNNESHFEAWQAGRTGVPIVDASMRQLREIGWMHNRARMIAASYLVKDLLIDWRWGEAWFMENLLDGDIAANNGGWQWTAGTGTDAAPYFRIFNPVLQSLKFDPNGGYIRRWVPELRMLDAKSIHAPWKHGIRVKGYPERPIIERDRVRTLQAYQASRETETA